MASDDKFHLSLKHLKEEKWRPNRDFSIAVWVPHARTATEGPSAVPLVLWVQSLVSESISRRFLQARNAEHIPSGSELEDSLSLNSPDQAKREARGGKARWRVCVGPGRQL